MEKIKTIVDRESVSSDYIGAKQNFGHVLSQVKNLKPPMWKSAWFYGPVGLAVVAITIAATSINPTNTLENKKTTISEIIDTASQEKNAANQIAYHDIQEVNSKEEHNTISSKSLKTDSENNSVKTLPEPIEVLDEHVIANNKEIITPVSTRKNTMPKIAGVFTGNISVSDLCSSGIEVNEEVKITSFTINYYSGKSDILTHVEGNKIPSEVCEKIKTHNIGNMIFITEIRGLNKLGDKLSFTSMNFLATK